MQKSDYELGDMFAKADQSLFDIYGRFYDGVNRLTGGALSIICNAMIASNERLYRMETTTPGGHTITHYTEGRPFPGWEQPKKLHDGSIERVYAC